MILQCEMKLIEKKEVELIYIIDIGKYISDLNSLEANQSILDKKKS